jgi:hypothetical protein
MISPAMFYFFDLRHAATVFAHCTGWAALRMLAGVVDGHG